MLKRYPFLFIWLTATLAILILPQVFLWIRDSGIYDEFYQRTERDRTECVEKAGNDRERTELCWTAASQATHAFTSAMRSSNTAHILVFSLIYGLSYPIVYTMYSLRKRIEKLEDSIK